MQNLNSIRILWKKLYGVVISLLGDQKVWKKNGKNWNFVTVHLFEIQEVDTVHLFEILEMDTVLDSEIREMDTVHLFQILLAQEKCCFYHFFMLSYE